MHELSFQYVLHNITMTGGNFTVEPTADAMDDCKRLHKSFVTINNTNCQYAKREVDDLKSFVSTLFKHPKLKELMSLVTFRPVVTLPDGEADRTDAVVSGCSSDAFKKSTDEQFDKLFSDMCLNRSTVQKNLEKKLAG